ncbi:MAG: hypothetical protein U9M89_02295 [Patescibacteria group bacterium]|nr:hypothetical protein [Patescibacteria group bacterium]
MKNMFYTIFLLVILVLAVVWVANNISTTENLLPTNEEVVSEEVTDETTTDEPVVTETEADSAIDDTVLDLEGLTEDLDLVDVGELPL